GGVGGSVYGRAASGEAGTDRAFSDIPDVPCSPGRCTEDGRHQCILRQSGGKISTKEGAVSASLACETLTIGWVHSHRDCAGRAASVSRPVDSNRPANVDRWPETIPQNFCDQPLS